MFAVLKFDSRKAPMKDDNKPTLFKQFKSKAAALKCAYTRNQMISVQTFCEVYYVFDLDNKKLLEPMLAA